MLKKALPVALVTGFVLAACGNTNDDEIPPKDETPMEDMDQRARDWTPEVNDENPNGTTGPNMDGLEENPEGRTDDDVLNRDDINEDNTLEGRGNAEGGEMGANGTPDGDNTAGTGNNGGSK